MTMLPVWLVCGSALAHAPPDCRSLDDDDDESPPVEVQSAATGSASDLHTSLSLLFEPVVPMVVGLHPQVGVRYTRHFSARIALDATVVGDGLFTTVSVGPRWYLGGQALAPYVFVRAGGVIVTIPEVDVTARGVLTGGGGLEYAPAPAGLRVFVDAGWTVTHRGENYPRVAAGIGYRF